MEDDRWSVCQANFGSLWASPSVAVTFPVEEADYIHRLPGVKRIGNMYADGGYLLYQFGP